MPTHLSDEVEQVEDSDENDGHPAVESAADNLCLYPRKQA